jgi:hypothetical protein
MKRVFAWISLNNKKRFVIPLAVIAALTYLLLGTNFFGLISDFNRGSMLDMQYFYTGNDFIAILNSLSLAEESAYLYMHIIDYIFIFTFYPTLTFLFDYVNKHHSNIVLLPILAMIFDLLENIIIDIKLLASIPSFFGSLAGIFTVLKFSILIISGILIVVNIYWNRRKHAKT